MEQDGCDVSAALVLCERGCSVPLSGTRGAVSCAQRNYNHLGIKPGNK